MAAHNDQFEKFRQATLGSDGLLSGALKKGERAKQDNPSPAPIATAPAPAPVKTSKNADRRLTSFHIRNDYFRLLGQLKFEMVTKYDELYNEAIRDLLIKYGKL